MWSINLKRRFFQFSNKSYYLSMSIIFLFLIGCSSTYKVTDYPSKAKFHEDINSSIKIRDVDVVTVDSSFTSLEGSRIKDDSLKTVYRIKEKISLREIRDIKYYGSAYEAPSASIWLKNGEELNTENVKVLPDSSVQFINITNELIPLMNVKHLSYTNHWSGLGMGAFYGMITGAAIGASGWILKDTGSGNNEKIDRVASSFWGAVYGIVIGTIVGAIIGWDNIYQFNP